MKCDVEIITYYDHARKKMERSEGWLSRLGGNTLTITSIGAVIYEDKLKVNLMFCSESWAEAEMDEIIKSAIVAREKVGVVELEMIE